MEAAEDLKHKIDRLAEAVQHASYIVAHTGAGISTCAGEHHKVFVVATSMSSEAHVLNAIYQAFQTSAARTVYGPRRSVVGATKRMTQKEASTENDPLHFQARLCPIMRTAGTMLSQLYRTWRLSGF